jgi:hypothetical protein
MKVEERTGTLTLSDNITFKNYRIKVNQNSFRQLYSGLYSDKVTAIIRELSTNAADAHIKAKTEVPFEVHLPNDLEPFFYVKDWGTGLSPEQIDGEDGLYITFFDSDKVHSDDFTGCLGLGSKSPFAYTDSFTVESRYNGKKYFYTSTHNEKGEPCIVNMGNVDTDEPNGMKIEFAVAKEDFNEFYEKAALCLSWFKVRPSVVGYAEFEFTKHDYLRQKDTHAVVRNQETSYAVMGNVAYPINLGDFSWSVFSDIERKVLQHGVHLYLDIGDVEFVPSREKLSITPRTSKGIKKYLGDAIKSIQEELEVQVQNQPTVWKARLMLHEIKHSILGAVRPIATINYNGKLISEVIDFGNKVIKDAAGIPQKDAEGNFLYNEGPQLSVFSRKRENYRKQGENKMHCNGNLIFFCDLERGNDARITTYLKKKGIESAYVITSAKQEFLAETGIDEVMILASSLPKPERIKQETIGSDGVKIYVKRTTLQQYMPNGNGLASNYWSDVEYDLREGGVYVITTYGQIVQGNNKTPPADFSRKIKLIKILDPDFELYSVRPAHLGKMGKYLSKWVRFDDYFANLLKSRTDLIEKVSLWKQYDALCHNDNYKIFKDHTFESHSLFGQFMNKWRMAVEANEDNIVSAFNSLNVLNETVAIPDKTDYICRFENNLWEVYGLFGCLDWWKKSNQGFADDVADYIRSVDQRRLNAFSSKTA